MDVNTILACAKHFAAYGAAIAGRDYNTVDISELTLREIYLPPFKAAHDAGVGSFMSAFNDFNGIPATGNHFLINGILKKEWNFKGFVVSDWGSIREMMVHGVAKTETDAAKMAITAGVDMDMMNFVYFNELPALVRDNQIKETKIDEAVGRILLMKKNLGLFEDPYRYCDEQRETGLLLHPQHLETAREVAKKSIVLLKNENNLLPLSKKITSIAVIGPLADNKDDLIATWSAKGEGGEAVSLLEGIKNKVSSQTKLYYAEGCKIDDHNTSKIEEAVNVAQNADVIIAVMGESKMMSGEALSRAYLDLPGVQNELLQQLHLTGKSIIVVLMNGRPLVLNWMSKNIPAILETWLLGTQAGNAIVDVLFGDYNPSGKLPVSFPYAVGQIPVYYNQKITGRPKVPNNRYCSRYIDIPNEPLYPFGFGLSYTTFEYSEIQLNKNKIQPNDTLTVTIKITNAGKLKGEEVVQLYLQDLIGSTTRPVKSLKKFKKIALYAGETREVGFKLSASDFGLYNQNMEFVVEPGDFNVFIGTNSIDTKRAGFVITE
jgi:beta-glucosidase